MEEHGTYTAELCAVPGSSTRTQKRKSHWARQSVLLQLRQAQASVSKHQFLDVIGEGKCFVGCSGFSYLLVIVGEVLWYS